MLPTESQDECIHQGLKLYDVIVDIRSLKNLRKGWKVYGKHKEEFESTSRLVAVLGNYKSGKTWIIKKLLHIMYPDRNYDLLDNEVTPSPGLCIILPTQSELKKDLEDEKNLTSAKVVTEKKDEAAKIHGFSFLSTQSFNSPCRESDLTDVRAVEYLLHPLIIRLSNCVVFVVSSFNRSSQMQIRMIMKQLQKAGRPVTKNNPLIVIHNLREVKSLAILKVFVEQLREVYDYGEDDLPILKEVSIDSETAYYDAGGSRHFFLGDNTSMKSYNHMVFKSLYSMLEDDQPQTINILKKTREIAGSVLPSIIREFSYELGYKIDGDGSLIIIPKHIDEKGDQMEDTEEDTFELQPLIFN